MSVGQEAELQALVDATKRRLASIEAHSAPSTGDRVERYLTEAVYAAILAATVSVWSVLGFVVWVPLLVRATALLAGTVFYVSLFRNHERLAHAQSSVHFAVRFYARGFEHFLAFYRQRHEPETPVGLLEPLTTLTRRDLAIEAAWVASMWTVTVFGADAAASRLFGS